MTPINKTDESIRPAVKRVLATMRHYKHNAIIHGDVFRSPSRQLELYRSGRSRLKWGFHNNTIGGKPAALAVDIIDKEIGWQADPKFWLCLGYAALSNNLEWGGLWGLPAGLRKKTTDLCLSYKDIHDCAVEELLNVHFGWDRAHIQTSAVSVSQARRSAT